MAPPPEVKREEEPGRERQLRGLWGFIVAALAISFSLFQMYNAGFGLLPAQKLRAVHLAFVLALIFLLYPLRKRSARDKVPLYDIVLALLAIVGPLYFFFNFEAMVLRAGAETTLDIIMGALTLVLVLEAARRAVGLALPIVAIVFLLYAHFGAYLPEIIAHRGYSLERIIKHLYPTTEGIFGIPLGAAATFVFLFILFGAVMQRTGISDYLIKLAFAGLGHLSGGPAKAAVLASYTMGTFSGSSTANVVTTGLMTIPLMKRVGFAPEVAGGVETAASAVGQLIPPVMGAAAFVMVEMTGIPYIEIIKAALIPAILDMFGLLFSVHMYAVKHGLRGLPREQLPPLLPTLFSQIYLLIPIVGLVIMLTVAQFSPMKSAFWSIPLALIIALIARNTQVVWRLIKMQLRGDDNPAGLQTVPNSKVITPFARTWGDFVKDLLGALQDGARYAVGVSAACACAGIIIGVITLTGLGLRLTGILIDLSGGQLWIALLLTMVGCIILGLGMPTTANYIITSTLMAPTLITLGVPVIAAHMFVFYFGILADDTPPVGVGAYAAAGIARADPIKTGIQGFKFDLSAFLIPYLFVFNPILLLYGHVQPLELIWVTLSGLVGVYALSVTKEGWWRTYANPLERLLMAAAAIALIDPGLIADLAGLGLMALVYLWQLWKVRRATRSV
ncbi:MAG: TRAP transporter permease [Candidatus Bipolaricaulota bacterium]|nr:TRAP transporter permease [Candidatus Bipolaricaulota bacterium]MDW8031270.1 TRAP transporter permease [Candidatus Bipolaricaulota bacterium]